MRIATCLLLACLLTAACSVRSPAPELWTLAPLAPAPETWDDHAPALSVAPVVLPRFLDRPQLLLRGDATRVESADGHRWADPLDEAFGRVLAVNLGRALASRRVSAYPVSPPYAVDYQLQVDVERFDGRPGETLELDARWVVSRGVGGEVLAVERSRLQAPAGTDMAALVRAHSEALASLAEEIGARIRLLETRR